MPSSIDHMMYYRSIVNKKKPSRKADLQIKMLLVERRFQEYIRSFSADLLIGIQDSQVSGDLNLQSCYTSGGRWLQDLKEQILSLQSVFDRELCMYCRIKTVDSFDHYLPKESFPEYSAFALNLLPCCTTCNGKKKEYWKEGGVRGIINFYIDSLPIAQFLFCEITYPTEDYSIPSVAFEIKNFGGLPTSLVSTIRLHYNRLELLDRYLNTSPSTISELKRTLNTIGRHLSPLQMRDATLELAQALEADYGPNYWKSSLYQAISASPLFFERTLSL